MKYLFLVFIFVTTLLHAQKYKRELESDSIHTISITGDSSITSRYRIISESRIKNEANDSILIVIDTLYDNLSKFAYEQTDLVDHRIYKNKYFLMVSRSHFTINVNAYEFHGKEWKPSQVYSYSYGNHYSAKALLKDDMHIEIRGRNNIYLLEFRPETKSFIEQKIAIEKH